LQKIHRLKRAKKAFRQREVPELRKLVPAYSLAFQTNGAGIAL